MQLLKWQRKSHRPTNSSKKCGTTFAWMEVVDRSRSSSRASDSTHFYPWRFAVINGELHRILLQWNSAVSKVTIQTVYHRPINSSECAVLSTLLTSVIGFFRFTNCSLVMYMQLYYTFYVVLNVSYHNLCFFSSECSGFSQFNNFPFKLDTF